jgi:hypothetical protein
MFTSARNNSTHIGTGVKRLNLPGMVELPGKPKPKPAKRPEMTPAQVSAWRASMIAKGLITPAPEVASVK